MKSREKDLIRLEHIIDAVMLIEKFSKDISFDEFTEDLMAQNAIIRQLEIIGEASYHLTTETKRAIPEIEWNKLRKFRNLLIHEYYRVDAGEVWSGVENDIPVLKEQIQSLTDELKDE